jgi:Pectate lyase superfamily protein
MRRWVPFFAALVLLVQAAPAAAETFTVTTTTDSNDPCSGTNCPSIRRALAAAESIDGADTIVVPPGDYALTSGVLMVDSPVTIVGAGIGVTTVRGTDQFPDQVFNINQPVAVTISHLTMADGFGGWGGNLINSGTLTLDHIRSTRGDATSGGGLANVGGTMTVTHSLIDDNESLRGGGDSGGIVNINSGSVLTVRHSTIAGNRSRLAGGIFAWGGPNMTTRLEHVTVVGNQGGDRGVGGVGNGDTAGFTVRASVLAGNTDLNGESNCGVNLPVSEGANVIATAECGFAAAGDVVADPQLGAFDGAVYPLGASSPAVDRAGACTGTDQRDLARPQGAACDSGAYELGQAAPPSGPQPTSQDPQPEFKETVVVDELSGTVKIRLAGTKRFVALDSVRDVPMGSEIDARKGVVELVSVASDGGAPQTARFSDGIFRVSQSGAVTVLTLTEKLSCATAGKASAAAKKVKKRRLWGDGKGRFRTKGKHSAATVVGTKWLVADTCRTTLTRVVRGKVKVRDFVKRKTVTVKAGGRYTARQKRR